MRNDFFLVNFLTFCLELAMKSGYLESEGKFTVPTDISLVIMITHKLLLKVSVPKI